MPHEPADSSLVFQRKLRAEFRRVGVLLDEIKAIQEAQLEAYLKQHPDIRERLKHTQDYDPDSFAWTFNGQLALEVLAALPDNAGTRSFLEHLDRLTRERGWSPLGPRKADA